MYPYLFGVIPTYSVFMILGVIAALVILFIYLKVNKVPTSAILDLLVIGIGAIIVGVLSSVLFDNIYKSIKYGASYTWGWSMTFMGGLFGGVAAFVGLYFLYYKRKNPPMFASILTIAPASITMAHAFGRIGCFCAGCCYGKPTDSWIGITFPGIGKVIPTQLIEAICLFIMAILFLILAFKKVTHYTMPLYMILYGITRFVIEFYRGDDRGQLAGLSPSQIWCIIMFIGAFAAYFLFRKFIFQGEKI